MDFYIFDFSEILISIINEKDIMKANQIEKTTGESYLNITIPANITKASDVIEGNFIGFNDLDGDFVMFEIFKTEEEESERGLTKKAQCENVFYELRDNVLEDERIDQATAVLAVNDALTGSRWSVGDIGPFGVYTQSFFFESSLSAINKIRNRWLYTDANGRKQRGTFKYRLILTGNVITSRLVDFKRQSTSFTGERVVIGKGLNKIQRTIDNSGLITSAYGRGKGLAILSDNTEFVSNQDQFGEKSVDERLDFSNAVWVNDFPTFANGGFEDGLTGWTIDQGVASVVTERFYRDGHSLKMTDTVNPTLLVSTDIFSVTAGQNLSSTVWVNTPTTIPDGRQKGVVSYFFWFIGAVNQGTSSFETYRPVEANRWELLLNEAVVPAGIDGVVFGMSTSAGVEPGDAYFDEFLPSDPTSKPLNQKFVEDLVAKALFGRAGGTINRMGFYEDNAETNESNLLTKTWEFIQNNNSPRISYEADIIDIDESIRLGDLIFILDENFQVPIDVTARAIGIDRDLLLSERTKITLGNFLQDTADINERTQAVERKLQAREDIWDRGNAFESVIDGTRIRMDVQQESEFQSIIKFQDDSIPPNLIGYFSPEEFSYKKIRCDEFVGQNIITVIRTPITYFIDSFAGDDMNDGLSLGNAFKTLTRLLANGTIPKILLNTINLEIRDTSPGGAGSTPYNEDVNVEGISGRGTLFWNFDEDVILNGSLQFSGCTAWMYVRGKGTGQYGFINSIDSTMPIRANQCLLFFTLNMWYNANSKSSFGLFANASRVSIIDCVIENSTSGAITGDNGCIISCSNCRGSNTGYAFRLTGASRGGIISSRPSGLLGAGDIVPFNLVVDGAILAPSSMTGQTPIGGLGSPAGGSSPTGQNTNIVHATSSLSWRLNLNQYRTDNDFMYQGSWGFGNHVGLAFFDEPGDRFSTIAGLATTIKSATFFVKRLDKGGYSTARNLRIFGTDLLAPPTVFDLSNLVADYGEIASLKWGEELIIDMPQAFLDDVNNLVVDGLAIFQSDEEPYVLLEGFSTFDIRVRFRYEP